MFALGSAGPSVVSAVVTVSVVDTLAVTETLTGDGGLTSFGNTVSLAPLIGVTDWESGGIIMNSGIRIDAGGPRTRPIAA